LKPRLKLAAYAVIIAAALISASITYLNKKKVDEYEEEVKKLFEEVRADISRIRNLTASEPVVVKIVDKRFFEAKAEGGVDELKAAREALYKPFS